MVTAKRAFSSLGRGQVARQRTLKPQSHTWRGEGFLYFYALREIDER